MSRQALVLDARLLDSRLVSQENIDLMAETAPQPAAQGNDGARR